MPWRARNWSGCMLQAREIIEAADVDPLDAFMAAEILPEVKQKEQEEAAKKEEERIKLAKQLAVRLPGPSLSKRSVA